MTDITKCSGAGCPLKESCYRFLAKEGIMQSYFIDPPLTKNNKCLYYWDLEKHKQNDEGVM